MAMFVVAYDIADPRRLQRVARVMERYALRTQRSVFLFRGTVRELEALLDSAAAVMDLRADVVQAWQLRSEETFLGRCRGLPGWLCPDAAIASAGADGLRLVPGRSASRASTDEEDR